MNTTLANRDADKLATVLDALFSSYFDDADPDIPKLTHDWQRIYNFLEIAHDYAIRLKSAAKEE